MVVPSAAVQMGQKGNYIYVVKNDSTVEYRDITVGSETDDHTIIEKGISIGETVVTDGQLRLSQCSKVAVKDETQAGSGVKK